MSPMVTKRGIRYRCDYCPRRFKTHADANNHLIHDHWGIPHGWGCDICNKK